MPSVSSRGRSGRRMKADINVVPYIDVMLVLLVIFMVTAPLITPGLIQLPSVGPPPTCRSSRWKCRSPKTARSHCACASRRDDAGHRPARLVAQRSRITAETPVVIAADGKVPYETVVKVMDELRTNGITRLGLLVDQSAGGNQPSREETLTRRSPAGSPAPTPMTPPIIRHRSAPRPRRPTPESPASGLVGARAAAGRVDLQPELAHGNARPGGSAALGERQFARFAAAHARTAQTPASAQAATGTRAAEAAGSSPPPPEPRSSRPSRKSTLRSRCSKPRRSVRKRKRRAKPPRPPRKRRAWRKSASRPS